MNFFKNLSASTSFPVCYNLLPHFTHRSQEYSDLIRCTKALLKDGRIQTFFLSDHPAQQQEFSSLELAGDILAAGGEPIVSLALSHYDRNSVVKRLESYVQAKIKHFVFVSGDYPAATGEIKNNGGFDLDSVQLLLQLEDILPGTEMARGCVVNPFKYFESEQIWQYEKLQRKIEVGADFIVSQIGYDLRKYDELLRYCTLHKIAIPLVANIFATDRDTVGLIQNRAIPGVKIPGPLLRLLQEGNWARQPVVDRTAKQLAAIKGLGYHGTLLGGSAFDCNELKQILDKAEEFAPKWQGVLQNVDFSDNTGSRYYYFQKNPQDDLNSNQPAPVALKHFPTPAYTFSYFVDWLIYVPQAPLFRLAGRFCFFCSRRKIWYTILWLLEYLSKKPLYGCKMCGDCTLYACGFLCYQADCPKRQLNGPCGGSIDGYCEVFPAKKKCFWVKAYHNIKGVKQYVSFVAPPIPARDVSLDRTSSWINFFMGRDHRKLDFDKLQE